MNENRVKYSEEGGNFKLGKWSKLITSLINVFYPYKTLFTLYIPVTLRKLHPNAYY